MRAERRDQSLGQIALIFLRLGATAFGGPAAHIALMEREFVRDRDWLTHEEFMDMIGAANLVPGPSSTEVALHVGYRIGGWLGLVIAGICFIIPAAILVTGFAWAYVRFGSLPSFHSALYGIKPVVVAVVAQAIWHLGIKAINSVTKGLLFVVNAALFWIGISPLPLLLGSGLLGGLLRVRRGQTFRGELPLLRVLLAIGLIAALPISWQFALGARARPTDLAIFLYFLKLGSVLYGSGYVLLAFLDRDLVGGLAWLTRGQLFDAIAVGQFTPGPVFTTATFIGYILGGFPGAVVATLGIFLPAFVFVWISGHALHQLRLSPVSSGFLDGVNASALALMAVVMVRLALDAIVDIPTMAICAISVFLLIRFRVNSAFLIAAGALVGIASAFAR